MAEYILRSEILKHKRLMEGFDWDGNFRAAAVLVEDILKIQAADVTTVRHGRWLFVTAGQQTSVWCCSECGRSVAITCDEELRQGKLEKEYPFCHCGAKMFEEK